MQDSVVSLCVCRCLKSCKPPIEMLVSCAGTAQHRDPPAGRRPQLPAGRVPHSVRLPGHRHGRHHEPLDARARRDDPRRRTGARLALLVRLLMSNSGRGGVAGSASGSGSGTTCRLRHRREPKLRTRYSFRSSPAFHAGVRASACCNCTRLRATMLRASIALYCQVSDEALSGR